MFNIYIIMYICKYIYVNMYVNMYISCLKTKVSCYLQSSGILFVLCS